MMFQSFEATFLFLCVCLSLFLVPGYMGKNGGKWTKPNGTQTKIEDCIVGQGDAPEPS